MRPILQTVSPRLRRGLARAYVVVAVPWVAWFGFKILNGRNSHEISDAFRFLLIVPIGAPILCILIAWVIAGFREPASETDYKPLLARAVSQLPDNDEEARQQLYDRVSVALTVQLQQQNPPLSSSRIASEKQALSAATISIESDIKDTKSQRDRAIRKLKPASTILLFLSFWFPVAWMLCYREMALYWVARLPK